MSQVNAAMPIPVDSFDPKTREIVINYDLIESISDGIGFGTGVQKTVGRDVLEIIIEATVERLFELGHLTVRTVEVD